MTILDKPKAVPLGDDAELLFQEAKQRRRRRWLISGATAVVVVAVLALTLGLTLGRNGPDPSGSVAVPGLTPATGHPAAELSIRPALCYAPPLTLAPGQVASSGALPPCSASTQLSASNLKITPDPNNVNGYASDETIHSDSQFATYLSTPPGTDTGLADVLLPGVPAEGSARYVLGPAALTQQSVQTARATLSNGQWAVNLVLTAQGSTAWNALTQKQFHEIIGVVLNGKVISAPIIQPTQSSWTSFNGQVQVSGSFTQQQAKAIAADLSSHGT
jgi:preprotein translocase subunit SecD